MLVMLDPAAQRARSALLGLSFKMQYTSGRRRWLHREPGAALAGNRRGDRLLEPAGDQDALLLTSPP
jgi:hypothetical protein